MPPLLYSHSKLIDEYPLLVLPSLATALGLNEAIVLQQLHYLLSTSTHVYDGRKWVYNTYEGWQARFPFWKPRMLRSLLTDLEHRKLLLVSNYNHSKVDRTKWYSIDYDHLSEVLLHMTKSVTWTDKICHMDGQTLSHGLTNFVSSNQRLSSETFSEKDEECAPPLPDEIVPSKPKASRRCPEAYTPTTALREWAAAKYPQLDFEEALEAMRDYEFAAGHTDWDATLRTWLRTEAKRSRANPGSLTREERRRLAEEQSNRALEEIVNGTYTGPSAWHPPGRDGTGLSHQPRSGHEGSLPPGVGRSAL